MTSNIRGPEGPRTPPPSGPTVGGDAKPDLPRALDRVMALRQGGTDGIVARQGPCTDAPFDGGLTGKRQMHLERSLAETRPGVTEGWSRFVTGQDSFAGLLSGIAGGSGKVGGEGIDRLSTSLRTGFPVGTILSGLGGTDGTDMLGGVRDLTGDGARLVANLTEGLLDRLLGKGGDGLSSILPDSVTTGLRDEAARLLASGRSDARDEVRDLCRQVIMDRGILPELFEAAARGDGPQGLPQAVLSLHAIAGGSVDRLSPDLAGQLAPLVGSFAQRFDALLSSLKMPGFDA